MFQLAPSWSGEQAWNEWRRNIDKRTVELAVWRRVNKSIDSVTACGEGGRGGKEPREGRRARGGREGRTAGERHQKQAMKVLIERRLRKRGSIVFKEGSGDGKRCSPCYFNGGVSVLKVLIG